MSDPSKIKLAKDIGRKDICLSMALAPGSERVLFGSSDFQLYDVDFVAEKPEATGHAGHQSYVTGVALAGKHVVTGGYDRRLIWWDADSLEQVRTVDAAHERFIRGVEASRDGRFVVSVADDMAARVWEADSGKLLHELRVHDEQTPHHYPSMLYGCAISPDSQHIATVDRIGKIAVCDAASGKQVAAMEAPEMYTWDPKQRRHSIGGIRSAAFSPDGKLLAVGGMGQVGNIDHLEGKARVEIFDWQKQERTHEWGDSNDEKGLVECLKFHPQGNWLLAAGGANDGWLLFYDLADGKKALKTEKAPMHIHEIALSDKADAIYAVGHSKLAKWEM
jgi:WD40 repeat protein